MYSGEVHPGDTLANSTVKLSFAWNAFFFWGTWAVCIIGLLIVLWAALRSKRWERWTTQDILIVASLGVILEVYDNIIGDQFIKPLIAPIPGADLLQVHDLPYLSCSWWALPWCASPAA